MCQLVQTRQKKRLDDMTCITNKVKVSRHTFKLVLFSVENFRNNNSQNLEIIS